MADNENVQQLTQEGLEQLEKRLEYLKTEARQKVAQEIKEARAFGDLSENAEYDEAKNAQAKVEGEIANLEKMLREAHVVEEIDTQRVNVGTFVRLVDKEDNEEEYQIVGSAEADIAKGKISNESPVGKALLGRKVGATVRVETPGGVIRYKILEIHG